MLIVREHTTIPVPKVLAWSANASNPVGAEYIIMEKASGVQLFSKWEKMTELEQFRLIQNLTRLEGQLADINFPANGSLYLHESLEEDDRRIHLGQVLDPFERFCIGRSCDRSWHQEADSPDLRSRFDTGPCKCIKNLHITYLTIHQGPTCHITGSPTPIGRWRGYSIVQELSVR